MTPEERELLTKSIKLAEENNKMLRSMRRNARFSSFLRLIYWILILGAAFVSYYFLQPYLEAVLHGYQEMQKGVEKVTSFSTKFPDLPSWLGGEQATSTKN